MVVTLLHVYTVIIAINFRFITNIKLVNRLSLVYQSWEDSLTNNYHFKDIEADIYSLGVPYINLKRPDWPQTGQ
jgi:hypothetical protein